MPVNCRQIVDRCIGNPSGQYSLRAMSIAPGPQGTLETLRIMAGLSRDAMNYQDFCSFMANLICSGDGNFTRSGPDIIDRYLRSIFRYVNEDVETLYSPAYNVWQLTQTGYLMGDCDDISMMYAAVFNALGMRSRFVAMRTKPHDPNFYHVVVEVYYQGRWIRYDATVPPRTVHIEFGLMEVEV